MRCDALDMWPAYGFVLLYIGQYGRKLSMDLREMLYWASMIGIRPLGFLGTLSFATYDVVL